MNKIQFTKWEETKIYTEIDDIKQSVMWDAYAYYYDKECDELPLTLCHIEILPVHMIHGVKLESLDKSGWCYFISPMTPGKFGYSSKIYSAASSAKKEATKLVKRLCQSGDFA